MPMKIIDNFTGRLTRDNIGDMNSGLAKYPNTFGNDPFSNIGNLGWLEAAQQIDAAGAVITDLIVAAKPRLESGITYVYAIGSTGRLYKIQVNQPSGYNPNLDTPVLLATLTASSPTFKYGASITFFGLYTDERMLIGNDKGVTSIKFDGTSETAIGFGSFQTNCPRPGIVFSSYALFGNNNNLGSIDTSFTLISNTVLAVPLPGTTQVRDLDVSPDGNYVQITASSIAAPDMTSTTQDTTSLAGGTSYRFMGIPSSSVSGGLDITSYSIFGSYLTNSNISFGSYTYTMGYDLQGAAIYNGTNKILSLPDSLSPNFSAMFSTGNLLGFASPETDSGVLKANMMFYGQYDEEVPKGLFRFLRQSAKSPQTDIIQMPVCLAVSNLFYGSSSAGYTNNLVGSAKLYFSTLETNSGTSVARFWKFFTVPTGTGTAIGGVYETQQETSLKLFRAIISKKFKPTGVRFYVEPLVTNNSFKIDIIGSDGNPMSGGSETFTVGTNASVGQDYLWYTPQTEPTYSMGFRITNLGSVNWTGVKLEVDYEQFGQ